MNLLVNTKSLSTTQYSQTWVVVREFSEEMPPLAPLENEYDWSNTSSFVNGVAGQLKEFCFRW